MLPNLSALQPTPAVTTNQSWLEWLRGREAEPEARDDFDQVVVQVAPPRISDSYPDMRKGLVAALNDIAVAIAAFYGEYANLISERIQERREITPEEYEPIMGQKLKLSNLFRRATKLRKSLGKMLQTTSRNAEGYEDFYSFYNHAFMRLGYYERIYFARISAISPSTPLQEEDRLPPLDKLKDIPPVPL